MLQSLTLAAVAVIILWVVILGLYLLTSRRQGDIASEMRALEEKLDRAESDARQK